MKLDKELEKILEEDWANLAVNKTDKAIPQIKTVILEALKAEMPKEDYTHNVYAEGYNQAIDDCKKVCNKLLGDSK